MKFSISLLLTALLAFALCLWLPWWSIAIAAFVVAFAIPQKPGRAWLTGFSALFLLWGLLAFWIKTNGGELITSQVAALVKINNSFLLISATAFIGGLVGGMAALTGSLGRRLLKKS
jgi:hypothetical protein